MYDPITVFSIVRDLFSVGQEKNQIYFLFKLHHVTTLFKIFISFRIEAKIPTVSHITIYFGPTVLHLINFISYTKASDLPDRFPLQASAQLLFPLIRSFFSQMSPE